MRAHLAAPLFIALATTTASASARAEGPEPAPPTGAAGGQDAASKGTTDIDNAGKFAQVKKPEEEESTDATELQISAGGLMATGNSRSGAVTGQGTFRLRRKIHEFGAAIAANYGVAAADKDSDLEPNVANVQGKLRYDIFFHKRISAFVMFTQRHDPFQGLTYRLNFDPGFAFYVLQKKDHRLWFEAGYDLQHDIRCRPSAPDDVCATEMLLPEDETFTNHSARLFAGYAITWDEKISFSTGFEYLQSVIDAKKYRFVWDMAFQASIIERLSLAITFTLRYDKTLLPEFRPLDTTTAFNLVYKFF
ncbi:MAG: DUF481 domain-containing protein [Nannocystaceae bacterium]|nr:DUF481 domain-containing protein [Myxococcales bacterium]